MKDWDYAEFVKTAKNCGGPEAYVDSIKENAYEEGRESRNAEVALVGLGGLTIGGLLTWVWARHEKKKERRRQEKEAAKEAENELVQRLEQVGEEGIAET